MQELRMEETEGFKEMIKKLFEHFKELQNLENTPQKIVDGNKFISAAERLTLEFRFLATGETFGSLSFQCF